MQANDRLTTVFYVFDGELRHRAYRNHQLALDRAADRVQDGDFPTARVVGGGVDVIITKRTPENDPLSSFPDAPGAAP